MSLDAEGVALIEELKARGKAPTIGGYEGVALWIGEHRIAPGHYASVEPSDLYRHYRLFCTAKGYRQTSYQKFFIFLKKRGFYKYRTWKPRQRFRYCMAARPAAYFLEWVEANPTPLEERLTPRRYWPVDAAMDILGVPREPKHG